jgi:alkylhydroperoxidase family enzyme
MAEKLSRDAVSVDAADWDAVRAVGLDDEGCLELAHVVGVFNHLTRLADGLGISVDEHTSQAAAGGAPLRRPAAG